MSKDKNELTLTEILVAGAIVVILLVVLAVYGLPLALEIALSWRR